jgi:two-component system sensor histidine kinase GlrK
MILYGPTSIVRLIRRGFFLIALLVIVGQIAAIFSVDRLTRQSGQAVYEAADALHTSQLLATEIALMERSARQYDVVGDDNMRDAYLDHRKQFLQQAKHLASISLSEVQRSRLQLLLAQEAETFQRLQDAPRGSPDAQLALEQFWTLNSMGRSILTESEKFISQEVARIQSTAADTKRQLILQGVPLIVGAVLLALIYSNLINSPIRKIEDAIRGLGEGKLTAPIRVAGPKDLEDLGRRLDWLRERLVALEQHKATILRNISHELKTPLATVREGIELLNDRVPGALNRQQAEIVEILQANSLRLQRLIEDLINLSMAQQEESVSNRRHVELSELLNRVIDDQKLVTDGHRLKVKRALAGATVSGDPEKLKSVFENLLTNAIKYSPDAGEIGVTLRCNSDHAIVDVVDEGPGIDPGEREKVFDVFYRGRAAAQGSVKGNGLGLSIAQAYVHMHKGTIEVLDANQGTHIRVVLPLVRA